MGDVARRGDLPRNVLDSSGRRDFGLVVLERLRDLLRPLETSSMMTETVMSRRVSAISVEGDILCVDKRRLGARWLQKKGNCPACLGCPSTADICMYCSLYVYGEEVPIMAAKVVGARWTLR